MVLYRLRPTLRLRRTRKPALRGALVIILNSYKTRGKDLCRFRSSRLTFLCRRSSNRSFVALFLQFGKLFLFKEYVLTQNRVIALELKLVLTLALLPIFTVNVKIARSGARY